MKETRPFSMKDKIGYTLGGFRVLLYGTIPCYVSSNFLHIGIKSKSSTRRYLNVGDQIVGCHQRSTHRCIG